MDKSKKKIMQALPPIVRSIMPSGIVYDENVGRFRNERGQFVSSTEAQKNVITRESAAEISDGLHRLLIQFNRMVAYTSNLGNIKDAEYEAIKDASREAAIEAVDATPEPVESDGIGNLLSGLSSAFTSVKSSLSSIIETAIKAAFWGTGALLLLSGLLKQREKKDQEDAKQEKQKETDTGADQLTKPRQTKNRPLRPARQSTKEDKASTPGPDATPEPVNPNYPNIKGGIPTPTDAQLAAAPKLSSRSELFQGGDSTDPATRGNPRYGGRNVGVQDHPVFHDRRFHAGTDIAAARGTRVNAIAPGIVIQAGNAGGYGPIVGILHGRNLNGQSIITRYAHLSSINTTVDKKVNKGEKIGEVGSFGISTGYHLHFELIIGGFLATTQPEIEYIKTHVFGEPPGQSPGKTASIDGPGPLGPIIMGRPETTVAFIDTKKFIPPLDDSGKPIDKTDIRTAYNDIRITASDQQRGMPSIPVKSVVSSINPLSQYYKVLAPVAGLRAG